MSRLQGIGADDACRAAAAAADRVLKALRVPQRDGCAVLVLLGALGPEQASLVLAGLIARGSATLPVAAVVVVAARLWQKALARVLGERAVWWAVAAGLAAAVMSKPSVHERPASVPISAVLLAPSSRSRRGGRTCGAVAPPVADAAPAIETQDLGVACTAVVPAGTSGGHVVLVGCFARWINATALTARASTHCARALRGALAPAQAFVDRFAPPHVGPPEDPGSRQLHPEAWAVPPPPPPPQQQQQPT